MHRHRALGLPPRCRQLQLGDDAAAAYVVAVSSSHPHAVHVVVEALDSVDRLLDAERSGREERRIRTMLKTSKIPTGQTLENFDFAFQPAIERSRIETLATGAWVRNAEVVLMQGPPDPAS